MGLKEFRKWKKRQEFIEFLKEYGITEEDLKIVPKALEMYKNGLFKVSKGLTDDQKKELKEKYNNIPKPEDLIKQYTQETEEFYPNGKPKTINSK